MSSEKLFKGQGPDLGYKLPTKKLGSGQFYRHVAIVAMTVSVVSKELLRVALATTIVTMATPSGTQQDLWSWNGEIDKEFV